MPSKVYQNKTKLILKGLAKRNKSSEERYKIYEKHYPKN